MVHQDSRPRTSWHNAWALPGPIASVLTTIRMTRTVLRCAVMFDADSLEHYEEHQPQAHPKSRHRIR